MRTPILLWGDLVKGNKAITRRSLIGQKAHECMYAWVYLTEFLAVKRFLSHVQTAHKLASDHRSYLADFDAIWKKIDRNKIDPHTQLNQMSFQTTCLLNALVYSKPDPLPEIVELGQTFFSAIDKFECIAQLSKPQFQLHYEVKQLNWIGIDNSDFCNSVAPMLHQEYDNIKIYPQWQDFVKTCDSAIFHSRFVCSYAFKNSASFADFLIKNFECGVIEDAFSIKNRDEETYNHGQNEVFLNIHLLNQKLAQNGFETFIIDYYGDWPAGSAPCFVVKLLFLKKNLIDKEKFQLFLNYHGYHIEFKDRSQENILDYLHSQISKKDWKKIYRHKKIHPIWAKTDISSKNKTKNLLRYLRDKFLILKSGYAAYNLSGRNAEQELVRYLKEQK